MQAKHQTLKSKNRNPDFGLGEFSVRLPVYRLP